MSSKWVNLPKKYFISLFAVAMISAISIIPQAAFANDEIGQLGYYQLLMDEYSSSTIWGTPGDYNSQQFNDVIKTSDGNYVSVGYTSTYGWDPYSTDTLDNFDYIGVVMHIADYSQEFDYDWEYDDPDVGQFYAVKQTNDGGFIVIGYTNEGDGIIEKLDANGNVQWRKTFSENFDTVALTMDGGYIVTGWNVIVKYDAQGNIVWKTSKPLSYYNSVASTVDGGIIAAGDGTLDKYDANGNMQWQKTFTGFNWSEFNSIQLTSDGGYIVAGSGGTVGKWEGPTQAILVKYDVSGNMQWNRSFGVNNGAGFSRVQPIADGEYIAVGISSTSYNSWNWVIDWLDGDGNLEWQWTNPDTNTKEVDPKGLYASENEVVVVGYGFTNKWSDYGGAYLFKNSMSYDDAYNHGDTEPPSAPTGLTIEYANNSAYLQWNDSTDNEGISEYDIYMGPIMIGSTTDTSYVVEGATEPYGNLFTVRARDFYDNLSLPSSDTANPVITLTPSTTDPSLAVTIVVTASDNMGVVQTKWAKGNKAASYFVSAGNVLTAGNTFTVTTNGDYTVWATDAMGNQTVSVITITNITPLINYQYYYDTSGRIDFIQLSTGQIYKYTYDDNGNLLSIRLQ